MLTDDIRKLEKMTDEPMIARDPENGWWISTSKMEPYGPIATFEEAIKTLVAENDG